MKGEDRPIGPTYEVRSLRFKPRESFEYVNEALAELPGWEPFAVLDYGTIGWALLLKQKRGHDEGRTE